ncbi:MAG: nuclear transport factor 2 family protein [Rhizobiales bacterium]|nr:nuclear transport factor 2 family protein [Hyphomicrobiales bacterium]
MPQARQDNTMASEQLDFEQFMKQRADIAQAYVRGDAAPLRGIAARLSPATFFGPAGGYREGADKVLSTHEKGATQFEPGGDSNLDILHMAENGNLAYWVGFQRATAVMAGKKIPMKLRVTELFRLDGGAWKLIHRHADMLASEPEDGKEKRSAGQKELTE